MGIHTYDSPTWTVDELIDAKAGRTISAVLPALNEESTVGEVVGSIIPHVQAGLVDELIVVDSGSTDATSEKAFEAGARVIHVSEVFPAHELPPRVGKGEALWRGVASSAGDIIAFVDSDLHSPSPGLVPGVVGPLVLSPSLALAKAFYQRPFRSDDDVVDPFGGGRVTELVARPLLSVLAPELANLRQPLAGEYALRRDVAESLPFAAEYGVEIGLVLDVARSYGVEAIAQVGLGVREHRHRPLQELAVTSRQVLEAAFARLGIEAVAQTLPPDRPALETLAPRASSHGAG